MKPEVSKEQIRKGCNRLGIARFAAICQKYRCITTGFCPPQHSEVVGRANCLKRIVNTHKKRFMSKVKQNHSKWLHIRLKEEEYSQIHKKFEASTCRKISEYARRVLLDKPITVNQRNQSLDDFMAEMIRLRSELQPLGNNFNQAVKRLHTLEKIAEFKSWLLLYEGSRKMLQEKVENIKQKLGQFSDKWLQ